MSTVSQVVKQVIEDLSEAISDMVLHVIVLQEQNAEMPDNLPGAVGVLNQTALMLGQIAKELASTNYADFPDVSREIIDAGDSVTEATRTLDNSVSGLGTSPNRKEGWNGICEACRVMAGKTIKLLSIVYGAELKRLFYQADHLNNLLDKLDPSKIHGSDKDVDDLVKNVEEIQQAGAQLAQYMRERAENMDNPEQKKRMLDFANELDKTGEDMIDAINDLLNNPNDPQALDRLNKLGDKMRDLLFAGTDLAKETAYDIPQETIDNLPRIHGDRGPRTGGNPYQQALEDIDDVQNTALNDPVKFVPAVQQARSSVQHVNDMAESAPPMVRDKVKEILSKATPVFSDQVMSGKDAVKNPNNPAAKRKLDQDTNKLKDIIKQAEAAEKMPDSSTPFMRDNLEKLVKDLEDAMDPIQQIQYQREKMNDSIKDLKDGFDRGDPQALAKAANALNQNTAAYKQALVDAARNNAKPEDIQKLNEEMGQMDKNLEDALKLAREGLGDINNPDIKDKIDDSLAQFKRAADRAGDVFRPPRNRPEKTFRDESNNIPEIMKLIRNAVKRGDPEEVFDLLKALRDARNNLRSAADRIFPDDERVLSELEKLWDKFKNRAPMLAKEGGPMNELDDIITRVEDELGNLKNRAKIDEIAAVNDVEDGLDDMLSMIERRDPTAVAPKVKEIVKAFDDIEPHINNIKNPNDRRAAQKELQEGKDKVRDLLVKSKAALQDPTNVAKRKDVEYAVDDLNKNLKNLKKYLDPDGKARDVEAAVADAKDAFNNVQRDLMNNPNSPADTRMAIQKGNDVIDKLNDYLPTIHDPTKRKELDDMIDDFNNLIKKAENATDPTTQKLTTNDILDNLNDILDVVKSGKDDDVLRKGAKASNLLAKMGNVNTDAFDLSRLMNCAADLSGHLKNIAGTTSNVARNLADQGNLSATAQSAADLDLLIQQLDAGNLEFEPINTPPPPPTNFEPPRPINENPMTFEDTVDKVAFEIHQKAETLTGGGYEEGINVANELFNLSGAARDGDRQAMLLASKTIDAQIKIFCKKLDNLQSKIKGNNAQQKREKERLHRCMQALRNYGMQLKILTSVKAASIDTDRDTDESLNSLTTNLGNIFTDALTAIEVVNKTGMAR